MKQPCQPARKLAPLGAGLAVLLMWSAAACNTVSPDECWLNPTGGLGGAEMIPIGQVGAGAGSVGSPARHPLADSDEPNPCLTPGTPCEQKCLTDYEARAAGCGITADPAARKVCQDDAYAKYKGCRAECQQAADCREHCKDLCYSAWEKCRDTCPKGDRNCLSECTNTLSKCNRECDRKCK